MLSLKNFKTTIYDYALELLRINSNTASPNRGATISNMNWAEIEKYLNNLRQLVIEIAETLDIEKLIADVIQALRKQKAIFELDANQGIGTSVISTQFGVDYTITRTQESNGREWEITGFDTTRAIIAQARYRTGNQVVDVDIRFTGTSMIINTFEPITSSPQDQSLLIITI